MFFGRKKELKYLKGIYDSKQAEFVTLYGRRRIGKTELLKQAYLEENHIFYSAKECTDYEQLRSLSEKILGKDKYFDRWETLLKHIQELASREKLVLILDEFPYMVKGNPALPSILQNAWDHGLKDTRIKIIICGSSMSFMEKEVLSEKNPLYGRMTGIYKVDELTFGEMKLFFPSYNDEQILSVYSILGGVPHYLLQFNHEKSIEENICERILSKGSVLYNEVDFLLKQELREPQVYYTIIEKIAMGSTKLNEIHTKTQISTSKLSVYLKNLIELGIIEKEYPVTERLKVRVNLHSGIYKLSTHFFLFYFRFVFPNISDLEEGLVQDVYSYDIQPDLSSYVGPIYEKVCRTLLIEKIRTEKYPYRIKYIGRWWDKQQEIDILGFTEDKYIVGECKWRNKKLGIDVYKNMKLKTESNFRVDDVHYYLFSKSGFTKELLEEENKNDHLHLFESITI